MRTWLRSSLRVIAALLIAVAILAGLALATVTGRIPVATRALVEWSAARALGAAVDVGDVRGSLLGAFELRDVSIARPGTAPAATARSIRIEVGEVVPSERRIVIQSLTVVGAELAVAGTPDAWSIAGWPLGEESGESDAGTPSAFTLSAMELHLGEVWVDFEFASSSGTSGAARARLDLETHALEWPPTVARPWPETTELSASIVRASWSGRPVGSAELDLHQAGSTLDFELTANAGGTWDARGRADLAGALDAPAIASVVTALRVADLDLATLAGDPALDSSLSGEFRGTWDGDVIAGRLGLGPSRWGPDEIAVGDFEGRVWPRDDWRFVFSTARLAAPFAAVDASAAGDRRAASSLTVRELRVDLGALPERWRPHADLRGGRLRAQADLAGPWTDLRGSWSWALAELEWGALGSLDALARGRALGERRVRIEALEIDSAEFAELGRVVASAPFEVTWFPSAETGARGGPGLSIRGAAFQFAGGVVELDGGFGADAFRELRITSSGLELARLTRLARLASTDAVPVPTGRLRAELELDGPRDAPRLEGSVVVTELAFEGARAERIAATLAPAPQTPQVLELRAELVEGGAVRAELEARFPATALSAPVAKLRAEPQLRAHIALNHFEWAPLTPLLPDEFPTAGWWEGEIRVAGPLEIPGLAGHLTWHEPKWRDLEAERVELELGASDPSGPWSGTLALVRAGGRALEARFELPRHSLRDPSALLRDSDTRLEARFDQFELEWLAPLLQTRTPAVSGRIHGTLRFAGASPVPRAEGALDLAELSISGPPLPTAIGPASGRLTFLGHGARLDELVLASEQGEARLWGSFDWRDPGDPDLDVSLQLAQFRIVQPGTIEGLVDGQVHVAGRPTALRATGELTLHEAAIELPDIEDPVVREIRVSGLPAAESASIFESEGGLLSRVAADVALVVGESVWLRGLGAELELRGKLRVRKARDGEPGLYGSVETTTGRIDFRRKWLRIDEGSAVFDGAPEPDPYLDITAVHRVRDVEIRVRIFGKASAPQIELESDPPLTPEEQLAYLLFDRPLTDLGAEDQDQLGTAAGVLAADALLGEFGTEVARSVGLDRIRLGVDEEQAPVLEIEKQLHPRLVARYGRSFGTEGGDRFVLEWRLFRRLFLTGEQRTSGDSGVGLLWRYDF